MSSWRHSIILVCFCLSELSTFSINTQQYVFCLHGGFYCSSYFPNKKKSRKKSTHTTSPKSKKLDVQESAPRGHFLCHALSTLFNYFNGNGMMKHSNWELLNATKSQTGARHPWRESLQRISSIYSIHENILTFFSIIFPWVNINILSI